MSLAQSGRNSHLSFSSAPNADSQGNDSVSFGGDDQTQSEKSIEPEDETQTPVYSSGEGRLMRAINEVLGYNSRKCSTGCLYSMDELIPTGYLLLIEEQNNAWFHMQLGARCQPVQLWYADFSARLQEALDDEARGRLFIPGNTHVFAGAKHQTAGAPLHCRRFSYLPEEVLDHPTLMLHHLPISPDQLLLIDHVAQAAAYVPVVVGFSKQIEKQGSVVSTISMDRLGFPKSTNIKPTK